MQNYFTLETTVAHRQREWERAVAAASRAAQARPENGPTRWLKLPQLVLGRLRSLATPRVPVSSWNRSRGKCAQTLEGGHATAT